MILHEIPLSGMNFFRVRRLCNLYISKLVAPTGLPRLCFLLGKEESAQRPVGVLLFLLLLLLDTCRWVGVPIILTTRATAKTTTDYLAAVRFTSRLIYL